MAKRRMTDADRAYLERTRLMRLREDYERLTMGQRVEQQAALSADLTTIRASRALLQLRAPSRDEGGGRREEDLLDLKRLREARGEI